VPLRILVISDDGPIAERCWDHQRLEHSHRISLTRDYSRSFKRRQAMISHDLTNAHSHQIYLGDALSVVDKTLKQPNHGFRAVVVQDKKPQLTVQDRMDDGMCRLAFWICVEYDLPVISFHSRPLDAEGSQVVAQTLASILRHMRSSWIHLDYLDCEPAEVDKWLFVDNNELPLRSRDLTLFSQHSNAMFVVGKMADEDTEEIEAHAPNT